MQKCTKMRTTLIESAVLKSSGAIDPGSSSWVTQACGRRLYSASEREAGLCRHCAGGWSSWDNYPADQPRPERP